MQVWNLFKLPFTEFDFENNIIDNVKSETCIELHKIQDFFPLINCHVKEIWLIVNESETYEVLFLHGFTD